MATLQLSRAREWRWFASRDRVNVLDVAVGLLLSVDGVLIVTGVMDGHGGVEIVPALGVLGMTLPVIWRRRWPVGVAIFLGAAAVFNCLVIGRMVRCGAALPALMLVAYALGRQPDRRSWWATALGLAALLVSATLQCFFDPRLDRTVLYFMVPVLISLLAAGALVESRSALVERLRVRNNELRQGRERIAALAKEADRGRIATNLGGWLANGIDRMERGASRGMDALVIDDRAAAHAAFDTVGKEGREALQRLRQVVGTLLETEGTAAPEPTLRRLDRVAGDSDRVRIEVRGERRALSPALELTGYRTVELLIRAFEATPRDPVRVSVGFGADTLELLVRGRITSRSEGESALAAARIRVALHRGTLSIEPRGGESEAVARVPIGAPA